MAEAHGGYICQLERMTQADLLAFAQRALARDLGESADAGDVGLQVSFLPHRKVVRFAFDAPFTYGRKGALWYQGHHALAELLSVTLAITVHAYVFDPEGLEEVSSYGAGRRVGGEKIRYEDAEWPDDDGDLDEASFARMQAKWPLGHLAHVFGLSRDELLSLPRLPSVLLPLDGSVPSRDFERRCILLMAHGLDVSSSANIFLNRSEER